MTLADLLRENLDVECDEVWEDERTLKRLGVRRATAFDGTIRERSRGSSQSPGCRVIALRGLELAAYTS